jgi:hypothetical protein
MTSSDFARVGLVSLVAVILSINTLSSLVQVSKINAPPISGPPLYQAPDASVHAERAAARPPVTDARPKLSKITSTASALLILPQKSPAGENTTTGLAPLPQPMQAPPPVVAEAEASQKPESRAAGPKQSKNVRLGNGSMSPDSSPAKLKRVDAPPPIYTRDVQMSVY